MPKVCQTTNLLDENFNLVTLSHGDEIPKWALPRFLDEKSFCICEEPDVKVPPIEPVVVSTDALPAVDYSKLNKKPLAELCAERGLDTSGNKPDLVARLVESDAVAASAGETEAVDIWSLTFEELTRLAEERNIDIGDATTTTEIAALLEQGE